MEWFGGGCVCTRFEMARWRGGLEEGKLGRGKWVVEEWE